MPGEQRSNGHVLIVDDDADVRELFADFVRERGFVVASVTDGRAAVAELERSRGLYRIVFTDLVMPGADGFEVLRAARAAQPSAYVIMVTGYASIDTAIQAIREGANDYIAKPCSLAQIDLILRRAAEHFTIRQSDELIDRLSGIEQRLSAIELSLTRLGQLLPPP